MFGFVSVAAKERSVDGRRRGGWCSNFYHQEMRPLVLARGPFDEVAVLESEYIPPERS